MHAVAGGQVDGLGVAGGVTGDVHTGVPDADHQHALALEDRKVTVVVRVEGLAGELTLEVRDLRARVVAVRDQHVLVLTGRAVGCGDLPVVTDRLDLLNGGVERDPLTQPEVVGEIVEVLRHLVVGRVVRPVLRHRVARVLRARAARVEVQRVVGRRAPVVVVDLPQAPDVGTLLEPVEVDVTVGEGLAGGEPRRAGPDHTGGLHVITVLAPRAVHYRFACV